MGTLLDRGYIENGGKNLPTLRVHHSDIDDNQKVHKKKTTMTKTPSSATKTSIEETIDSHNNPNKKESKRDYASGMDPEKVPKIYDKKESQNNSRKVRSRHGARNQHRHKHLVKWIVNTFPEAIKLATDEDSSSDNEIVGDAKLPIHILDVAGGKGELAARLTLCHKLHVKMIDPRPCNILDCFNQLVFRSLPKKWQEKISSQDASIIENAIKRRFQQLVIYFPSDSDVSTCLSQLHENEELLNAVKYSSLMIGMHADGATESIVDVAMKYRKPFMVVPCCVFPNLFKHRFIPRKNDNDDVNDIMVPVRSHEQFCKYLLMKDSHFVMETLPFEGRNVAIWWDGNHLDTDKQ